MILGFSPENNHNLSRYYSTASSIMLTCVHQFGHASQTLQVDFS